jgi:hypothetical protein
MSTDSNNWLAETQKFFFQGASRGWAGGNSGSLLQKNDGTPSMENWREVIYQDHLGFAGYHFADRWGTDPDSGRPSGSMIITHWNIPVWGMWVGGESYNNDVIRFLRKVLLLSYREQKFFGGRGPQEHRESNLLYTNVFEGNFSRFSGREQIEYVTSGGAKQLAGSHEYWGGSFVFLPSK